MGEYGQHHIDEVAKNNSFKNPLQKKSGYVAEGEMLSQNKTFEEFIADKEKTEKKILENYHKGPDLPIANENKSLFEDKDQEEIKTPFFSSDVKLNPKDNQIYCLSNNALSIYNPDSKQIQKIVETHAHDMSFSPSGKYLFLFNMSSHETNILDSESNKILFTIKNKNIIPMEVVWSNDEKNCYFFETTTRYFSNPRNDMGYFENLIEIDIKTGIQKILINGKNNNIASVKKLARDNNGDILFTTNQNDNIYKYELNKK